MEYRLDSPSGELLGDGQTHVGQTAFESNFSAVAIGKLAPSVEMSFPNATVLWAQYYVDLEDVHGSIRLIGYATGSNTRIKLSIVSAGEPILLKSRPIEHVVIWGDDHTAQVHLTSPIMSVNGPRNTTLHLDGTFLGFFNTWGFPGEVTAPDGTKEELGFPNSWKLLKFPEQGPWTFSLDFSGGFLGNTRHYYLDGVFLPSLGIWAPG